MLRGKLNRLARKTKGYSKSVEMLATLRFSVISGARRHRHYTNTLDELLDEKMPEHPVGTMLGESVAGKTLVAKEALLRAG